MTLQGQKNIFHVLELHTMTHYDTIPSTINVISDAATAPVPVEICLNLNITSILTSTLCALRKI